MVGLGKAWHGYVRLGGVWWGAVRFGLVWHGFSGEKFFDAVWHG